MLYLDCEVFDARSIFEFIHKLTFQTLNNLCMNNSIKTLALYILVFALCIFGTTATAQISSTPTTILNDPAILKAIEDALEESNIKLNLNNISPNSIKLENISIESLNDSFSYSVELLDDIDDIFINDFKNLDNLLSKAPKNCEVSVSISLGGSGPLGIQVTVTVTFKVWIFKISTSYTIDLLIPDGQDDWEEPPFGHFSGIDIRWTETTAELISLSDEEDEEELLLKVPVYDNDNFAGYIVNTEFYSMYPNCIAYMKLTTTAIDTTAIDDCEDLIAIARKETVILDTTNNMCIYSMKVPKTGYTYLGVETRGPHATGNAQIIRDNFSDPDYDLFLISLKASSFGVAQDGIALLYTDGVDTCKIPRNFFCNCYCWNCPTANISVDLVNGTGHYELSVPLNQTNATIELLDFSGRVLYPVHSISPNDPLDADFDISVISNFPTGIYILATKQDNDGTVLGTTVFIKR